MSQSLLDQFTENSQQSCKVGSGIEMRKKLERPGAYPGPRAMGEGGRGVGAG